MSESRVSPVLGSSSDANPSADTSTSWYSLRFTAGAQHPTHTNTRTTDTQ